MGSRISIIVTGGTNNNYYNIGGMQYEKSVQIDPWRWAITDYGSNICNRVAGWSS